MDNTIIYVITIFFAISEFITFTIPNDKFSKGYACLIRVLVMLLSIIVMSQWYQISKSCNVTEIQFKNDVIEFQDKLIEHYDSLANLHTTLGDDLINHDINDHKCDCAILDSDIMDKIHEQEIIINNLYDSER